MEQSAIQMKMSHAVTQISFYFLTQSEASELFKMSQEFNRTNTAIKCHLAF